MLKLEDDKKYFELQKQNIENSLPQKRKVDKEEIAKMLVDLGCLVNRNATPDEKRMFVENFIPQTDIHPIEKQ